MPKAYSIYQMNNFPELALGDLIRTTEQMTYIDGMEPPKTELKLERKIPEMKIEVFRGLHEMIERKAGRAKGVEFTEFIAPYHFPAFYSRVENVLLLRVKKEVARGTMKELNKKSNIQGDYKKIELQSIKDFIERFKGVWFNVMDSTDVSSQALFGPSVDRDMRFERASAEGEMFYIRLDYPFMDEYFHIGISDDYSMVVFDNNLDEKLELELVLDVKKVLLDRARTRD